MSALGGRLSYRTVKHARKPALWGFHARCLRLGRRGTGLKNAPRALIGLLRGENFGKLLVRLAHASS